MLNSKNESTQNNESVRTYWSILGHNSKATLPKRQKNVRIIFFKQYMALLRNKKCQTPVKEERAEKILNR